MGEYKKPWLTFEEQADLLIVERGLVAERPLVQLQTILYGKHRSDCRRQIGLGSAPPPIYAPYHFTLALRGG